MSDLLKDIKEKISYKSQNLRFLNNDCKISVEDEATTKLREIIKDDYKDANPNKMIEEYHKYFDCVDSFRNLFIKDKKMEKLVKN